MAKAWWQPKERRGLRIGTVKVSVSFEPRDIWIGVFWDRRNGTTQVFVTIVPCFPVRFAWDAVGGVR